jgi:hypothetical protein
MGIEFHQVRADYKLVDLKLTTSSGEIFFMRVNHNEISFWSDVSSSGGLSGDPILKTADDLLNWFGDEGKSKRFRDRKQVQPPKIRKTGNLPQNLFARRVE